MKGIGVLLILFFCSSILFAQDSLNKNKPLRSRDSLVIDEKYPGLRIGIGLQKSFYTELGISYNKIYGSQYGSFGCYEIFTSALFIPKVRSQKNIYGAKIGVEGGTQGGVGGIEIAYLTDNSKHDVMITPKLGLGLFTYLVLSYGYSFSTNNRPFNNVGKHQFSIVSNIPPIKYFKKKKK